MLSPDEIPDPKIRKWYIERQYPDLHFVKTSDLIIMFPNLVKVFESGYYEYKSNKDIVNNIYFKWITSSASRYYVASWYDQVNDKWPNLLNSRFAIVDDMRTNGFNNLYPIVIYKLKFRNNEFKCTTLNGTELQFNALDGHHRISAAHIANIDYVPICYGSVYNLQMNAAQIEDVSRKNNWKWYQRIDFGFPVNLDVATPDNDYHGRKKFDRILKQSLHPIAGRSFLDIGCNAGLISACIAENKAKCVIGCDFPRAIEQARLVKSCLWNDYGNLYFYPIDILNINGFNEFVKTIRPDCILMSNVLYYFGDKTQDIADICLKYSKQLVLQGNNLKRDKNGKETTRLDDMPNYRGEYTTIPGMLSVFKNRPEFSTEIIEQSDYVKPVVIGRKL